jgi:hypothetical protein
MVEQLRFGDRISVFSSGIRIDGQGIFIRFQDKELVWVGLGTSGAFTGQPTLFYTSLKGITIEKIV